MNSDLSSQQHKRHSVVGMTLIEVLLSVAILAILMTLAARSITQAVKSKVKIQSQIDDVAAPRDALRLMERDINLAFHYRDIEKELDELIKKKTSAQPGTTQTNPDGTISSPPPVQPTTSEKPREAPRKDPTTHFIGTNEKLDFVTMNNTRVVEDIKQADFTEVGYFLKQCSSTSGTETKSSQCLWRRSSNAVDDDVTRGGVEIVLLENVTEFSLKYIGKGKQDWVTSWSTDAKGDGTTKGNFPLAVQISLSTERETPQRTKKKYSWQIVASIHFPNNKEGDSSTGDKAAGTPSTSGTSTQGGP